jgi:hypothetical protein
LGYREAPVEEKKEIKTQVRDASETIIVGDDPVVKEENKETKKGGKG